MNNHQTKHHWPLVSVVIPAYNAEAFIEKTLDSVLTQTYQNIEVFVVDDGSQDRTAEIVEYIASQDERVILLRQENAGVAAARNLALKNARGEYIATIDADDIWFPTNLEKQVQCMLETDPSVGVVYSWSLHIDESGALTKGFHASTLEGEVLPALICSYFLGHSSASLIRRACFEQVGYYNCQLRQQNAQGCEDWDLHLRIAEHYQFRVVPEFLVGYRQVSHSMSSDFTAMIKSRALVIADVQQRHPEISPAIYRWSDINFYIYLAFKCRHCGNHRDALLWLYKAVGWNLFLLLSRPNLRLLLTASLLKFLAQPVTRLIWPNHAAWLQFKQQLKTQFRRMTIADVASHMSLNKYLFANRYAKNQVKKWPQEIKKIPKTSAAVNLWTS